MRLIALAPAAVLVLPATLSAQVPPDAPPVPYSQIHITLAAARNVNREPLHEFWRAGTGGRVAVRTPFYVGSIGVSTTLMPFHRRDSSRPNFRALLIGLDWGLDIPAPRRVDLRAVAQVGDFVVLIENPDLWLDSESELFLGGELSASVALWKTVSLTTTGSYAHVHTRPSLDLAFVTVGLEYATRTPRWLRAILE